MKFDTGTRPIAQDCLQAQRVCFSEAYGAAHCGIKTLMIEREREDEAFRIYTASLGAEQLGMQGNDRDLGKKPAK